MKELIDKKDFETLHSYDQVPAVSGGFCQCSVMDLMSSDVHSSVLSSAEEADRRGGRVCRLRGG